MRFDLAKERDASTVLLYCFDSALFDLICGNEFEDCFDFDSNFNFRIQDFLIFRNKKLRKAHQDIGVFEDL